MVQFDRKPGESFKNLFGKKENPDGVNHRGFAVKSLAVSYFRMGKPHTIIGAERFHFRVRDGIGWFPLAMAARQAFYTVALPCNSRYWVVYVYSGAGCVHISVDHQTPGVLGVIWSSHTVN